MGQPNPTACGESHRKATILRSYSILQISADTDRADSMKGREVRDVVGEDTRNLCALY